MPLVLSTFSIVALDPETGEVGVAVATRNLAVGSMVPWARAGAGAIATQAESNMGYGPKGLDLLAARRTAQETVELLTGADEGRDRRQVGVVDTHGRAAAWTGRECQQWAGHRLGEGYTCQGNILAGPEVVEAMASSFEATSDQLPERMMAALEAAQASGGDSRGKQSAALYVAKEGGGLGGHTDRYVDIRVDDHAEPLVELRRLLTLHRETFRPPR